MRILHTSDWHLGRSIEKVSLQDSQVAFIDELVDIVKAEKVTAVLVSGDIYDRAIPNPDVIKMLEDSLMKLLDHTQVIITSGNHDNPQRLGFAGRLMEKSGLHIRTKMSDISRPIQLKDDSANIAVYGIPYLEPGTSNHHLNALLGNNLEEEMSSATHDGVLRKATQLIKQDLESRGDVASIVMAHAWITGAEPSDSERMITVGTLGNAGLSTLEGFTYGALGHIHKPQDIAQHVRYSGSPIKYSFSEIDKAKRVLIADFAGSTLTSVKEIELSEHRGMKEISGTLQTLLNSREFDPYEDFFIRARLEDSEIPSHAMEQLRKRFPYAIRLDLPEIKGTAVDWSQIDKESPIDVCCAFVDFAREATVNEWEKKQFVKSIASAEADLDSLATSALANAGQEQVETA